ncbi:uncharacterized protein TNCT_223001 [Trichonephila clavata]|uniref:Uncharacterized protein n=1 Tax=Trichonephila clavata TaxID=2740835 RepID=A0A8X6L620_TRICU|nr:uncharacterized protein TNCT_223001 [Trichonephila clavata]
MNKIQGSEQLLQVYTQLFNEGSLDENKGITDVLNKSIEETVKNEDAMSKKRKVVHSASTKFVNKVKSFLENFDSQNETNQEQLFEYLLNLDAKLIELQTLNKEVEDLLSDEELFEAEIEKVLLNMKRI